MKKKPKKSSNFGEEGKDKKDYEPIHPHTPRMLGSADLPFAPDAVSEAQGYGSRASSPDFNEGPEDTEQHLILQKANQNPLPVPFSQTKKSFSPQEGV